MTGLKRKLTVTGRATIELRLSDGCGAFDRSAGTGCDEVDRHQDDLSRYRVEAAGDHAAAARLRSGRKPRPGSEGGMERQSGLSVSHEAIYRATDAGPRVELRRELIVCLGQDKPHRGGTPKGSERRGKLGDMSSICERPEEVADRLVPSRWEGDLILGANHASAIGTLVKRTTRFVLLVRMPTRRTDVATSVFAGALNAIPAPLRQYFPKVTSLSGLSQDNVDIVARSLNDRPRRTLDFATPNGHCWSNSPAQRQWLPQDVRPRICIRQVK